MIPGLVVSSRLQDDLAGIRILMAGSVKCRSPEIQDCVDGLLANPGKLLRPSLTILSWRSAGGPGPDREAGEGPVGNDVLRVGAAIEMLHMATLVHDDVIDRAQTRRSQPSVYARYGARTAILVGDLLFSAAFQLVADLADSRLAAQLAGAIRAISESEILQMNRIDPEAPSLRQYLHQIIGKTAVLFAASCRAGAELAKAGPTAVQALQRAGYDIGMAFQVIDDILDFAEDGQSSGKTPGRDLELGLFTLPVLAALRNAPNASAERQSLLALLGKTHLGVQDVARVRDLVRQTGGFATARSWAERYTRRALGELAKLPDGQARGELMTLTRDLLGRQY